MQSPLHRQHLTLGAKLVPFAGWQMPLHYGSQIEEHHAVRRAWGVFDVSHMTFIDVEGAGARDYLRRLLANDVARLEADGAALYSCMLAEDGGILDDLIVYRRKNDRFRVVVNAATRDKDLAWMEGMAGGHDVDVTERIDLAMIAVQGPEAAAKLPGLLPETLREAVPALEPFHAVEGQGLFVGRTGYTGEDGFELLLPGIDAASLWEDLVEKGAQPCGLGARDTLRLEAGMNLYGTDMDESVTPLESGLGWTVAWKPADRDFIGREALEIQRDAPERARFTGLVLRERGVLRNGTEIELADGRRGTVTSGSFSPTLGLSIALARLPAGNETRATALLRGKPHPVELVRPPFVRHGKACIAT
ncbi:MAG: glycine cleavage system aminomethyltransferase GcvT [Gammaproteobacteria bacterium]|nr:glycine cleavage system aminomethyltransferase GcvT [Gammaproteobacteria bacterium]